jgi:hypothetical protein
MARGSNGRSNKEKKKPKKDKTEKQPVTSNATGSKFTIQGKKL